MSGLFFRRRDGQVFFPDVLIFFANIDHHARNMVNDRVLIAAVVAYQPYITHEPQTAWVSALIGVMDGDRAAQQVKPFGDPLGIVWLIGHFASIFHFTHTRRLGIAPLPH